MRYTIYVLLLLAWPVFFADPVYTWRYRTDDPDQVCLYLDGKQISGWCYRGKHYRPLDGETWGLSSEAPPVQPPKQSLPAPLISWQSATQGKSLRGRVQGSIAQAAAGQALVDALNDAFKGFDDSLYLVDLAFSAKLLAHIEMGGKVNDKIDSDDTKPGKELITNGSAAVFISERAKFAEKLRDEKFSNPVLAMIALDIEDDKPKTSIGIGSHPEDKFQSRLLFSSRDWREDTPNTIDPHTPAVQLFVNRRPKDAAEKIPVTVHCSFVFMTLKEGRAFIKTLCFDLYLEKLEKQKGALLSYPWKVRNVEYK